MSPPGRKRKLDQTIPAHIDQAALPRGLYWDKSGAGRWFVIEQREGRPGRVTVATRNARLSELHTIMEERAGVDRASLSWLLKQFHERRSSPSSCRARARTTNTCAASPKASTPRSASSARCARRTLDAVPAASLRQGVREHAHAGKPGAALLEPRVRLGHHPRPLLCSGRCRREGEGEAAASPAERGRGELADRLRQGARRAAGAHGRQLRPLPVDRDRARLPVPPARHRGCHAHRR